MKKNFTKKDMKADKKVTDFFSRQVGPSSSQTTVTAPTARPSSRSSTTRPPPFTMTTRSGQSGATQSKRNAPSISSDTLTSDKSSASVIVVSPPKYSTRRTAKQHMALGTLRPQNDSNSTLNTVRKRPRSPDVDSQPAFRLPATPRLQTPNKRKKKFQVDSENNFPRNPIFIKHPASSPTKLASLSSTQDRKPPCKLASTSLSAPQRSSSPRLSEPLVASSQSDEQELSLLKMDNRDPAEIKHNVERWREQADISHDPDTAMDVDPPTVVPVSSPVRIPEVSAAHSSFIHSSRHSETEVSIQLRMVSATSDGSTIPSTPAFTTTSLPSPDSDDKPLPGTPYSNAVKNAIEEITAKAHAAVLSSDGEQGVSLQLKDLDESDDELDSTTNLFASIVKGKSVPHSIPQVQHDVFSSPLSSLSSADHMTPIRRRRADSSSSSSLSPPSKRHNKSSARLVRPRRKSSAGNRLPTVLSKEPPAAKAKYREKAAPNPLDALLREKKREQQRGNDVTAIRQAEAAVKQKNRVLSNSFIKDEPVAGNSSLNHIDLADEDAAWSAIRGARLDNIFSLVGSPENLSASASDDAALGERETAMLGSQVGDVITKILASDKANKGKGKSQDKILGVVFWKTVQNVGDMDVDSVVDDLDMISIEGVSGHPILALLQRLIKSRDVDQLALIMRSGVLQKLGHDKLSALISPLFVLAASATRTHLVEASFRSLLDLWAHKDQPIISFTSIASALARLGADHDTMSCLQWPIPSNVRFYEADVSAREDALYRLVTLVTAAARVGALCDEADVVLSLLLVGLDPSTSNDLRRQLIICIDSICSAVDQKPHTALDVETALHDQILAYALKLTPVNKVHLLSYLSSGCGPARHLAQWLAFSLLSDQGTLFNAGLPPLDKVISLLTPPSGSGLLFDVSSETTDYEDLGHYVDILSIALVDIDPYIIEELQFQGSASCGSVHDSPSKSRRPLTSIEIIKNTLDLIHGKIVDTRAAHLDRSRTKSSLQRLALRICYQRLAIIRNQSDMGKPRNLRAYFAKT